MLYQKHIASEISSGIVSLQFETCSFHGFEKNVLVVATKDSSVFALDSDAGNTLSTNAVHPKKPSKALFMQILGTHTLFISRYVLQDNQFLEFLCMFGELNHVKDYCRNNFQSYMSYRYIYVVIMI